MPLPWPLTWLPQESISPPWWVTGVPLWSTSGTERGHCPWRHYGVHRKVVCGLNGTYYGMFREVKKKLGNGGIKVVWESHTWENWGKRGWNRQLCVNWTALVWIHSVCVCVWMIMCARCLHLCTPSEWDCRLRVSYVQVSGTWGDWDLQAATGHTECLSPGAGGSVFYIHLYVLHWQTSHLTSQRGDMMRLLVLIVFVRVRCVSVVCTDLNTLYLYGVYVCLCVCCAYWEYMLSLSTTWTWDLDLRQPRLCQAAEFSLSITVFSTHWKIQECHMLTCNKFSDLSIPSQNLEVWRGYYTVTLCLISFNSQIQGREREKEGPLDRPARQMDRGAFLFSWMISSKIAWNSLWCKRKDNKNLMWRKFSCNNCLLSLSKGWYCLLLSFSGNLYVQTDCDLFWWRHWDKQQLGA